LVLLSGGRPTKPLHIVPERATTVVLVDLGVEDSHKFKIFVSVNDLDRPRQNLFTAREQVWKVRLKRGDVENGVNM
jgi:hypothetical protein